jgi:hypothetical protein
MTAPFGPLDDATTLGPTEYGGGEGSGTSRTARSQLIDLGPEGRVLTPSEKAGVRIRAGKNVERLAGGLAEALEDPQDRVTGIRVSEAVQDGTVAPR